MKIPGIGISDGMSAITATCDGLFHVGENGVSNIFLTGDKKVEFVVFKTKTLAHVLSSSGYPAYYPCHKTELKRPIKAVLMDLDGTSVRSERFWMEIIQSTVRSLLHDESFTLKSDDIPYVSGHSVSEHLAYCIHKYAPNHTLEEAKHFYFEHERKEMREIIEGKGKQNAFLPSPGLKEFLYELKQRNIKIALVTSGLYEKAYPEILSAFKTLEMGDPKAFYDCIISAGYPLEKGNVGTLGELCPKPHPWLYAEAGVVGLGIPFEERGTVIGIDDSGAGAASIALAGYPVVGYAGGNIEISGMRGCCDYFVHSFSEILTIIDGK